jgi:hypothetical protein
MTTTRNPPWRRAAAVVLTASLAAALVPSAASAASAASAGRGSVVSAKPLMTLADKSTVDSMLTADQFSAETDRYGVQTYQLVYRTVDADGRPTTASGLLALPLNNDRHLRVVSFAHGTEVFKRDAPSTSDDVFLVGPSVTYASAGYAAVAPDYVGLGESPGPHPWMDVPTETTASLDLLRAARTFAAGKGKELGRDVYASGFSQGASAALGLGRALQSGTDPYFRLGALAPVSGGYAFREAEIPALFTPEVQPRLAVAYTAYLLAAYQRLHHIYSSPADVFEPNYVNAPNLFDGTHHGQELLSDALPDSIHDLLTDQGEALLTHPNSRFAAALREQDSVCEWAPRVPMRLVYSSGDEQAVNANTTHCQASFAARGIRVPTWNIGVFTGYSGMVHEGSQILALPATVRWFSSLR